MSTHKKIVIHVLVQKCAQSHKWVAQGLEHDIVAQADTMKLLERRFLATVLGYLHASGVANTLDSIKPAPHRYWTVFRKIENQDRSPKIKIFPKQSNKRGEAVFLQAA